MTQKTIKRIYQYTISGKHHQDITDEFVDIILEDLFIMNKEKTQATLQKNVKLAEHRVIYIQAEEPEDKKIDKRITGELLNKYGIEIEKTIINITEI